MADKIDNQYQNNYQLNNDQFKEQWFSIEKNLNYILQQLKEGPL